MKFCRFNTGSDDYRWTFTGLCVCVVYNMQIDFPALSAERERNSDTTVLKPPPPRSSNTIPRRAARVHWRNG